MNFKQFLEESRFAMFRAYDNEVSKEEEKKNANVFLSKYNGNHFHIDTGKNKVVFTWTIHAMSRFIERKINQNKMQSLLHKVADDFVDYPINKRFLVFSKKLNQGFVISKSSDDHIAILTVYPEGDNIPDKRTHLVLIENIEYEVECFYYE